MEHQPPSVLGGVGGLAVKQTLTNCREAAAEKVQQAAKFKDLFVLFYSGKICLSCVTQPPP